MGKPANPKPALLFTGILYSDKSYLSKAKESLLKIFGSTLLETPQISWDFSEYYKEEIGSPIMRTFIFFKDLINRAEIADIKLRTNDIETSLSIDGKRKVNLDPGYLTLANVILATTKGYAHRIYLGKGIYGEVSLLYREKDKAFVPNIFTYSDYQDKKCIEMFVKAREFLKLNK
ncbi:MAG: DUF4416 family protein [Thermodesulfovibrionales bacterium]|nr:DUF4416 family protein [Thermodesulfovibrionales bacterium]